MIAGRIAELGSDLIGSEAPKKFFGPFFVISNINYGGIGEPVQRSFRSMGLEISNPVIAVSTIRPEEIEHPESR